MNRNSSIFKKMRRSRNRMKVQVFLLFALLCYLPVSAFTQSAPGIIAQINVKMEIAAALYAAAATQAAAQQAADTKIQAQRKEIENLRAKVNSGETRLVAELTSAQEQYVTDLSARDRAYAQEIAVFRTAIEDVAATPEGAAALARFNAGDEIGAVAVLDDLRAARDAGRKKRADIESAAEGRRIATLALEARNKGKMTIAQVITRYEEVTRLDPSVHWDWINLGRLYTAAGKLPDALRAAKAAGDTATDDRGRSVAFDAMGNVQAIQGDLTAALASYRASLAISERLAQVDPGNSGWQRGLSISHNNIGDVQVAQGDLTAALTSYRASLAIREHLAQVDPGNSSWQRDLIVSYVKLNDVTGEKTYIVQALNVALAMQKRGILAPRDAWMIKELQRRAGGS